MFRSAIVKFLTRPTGLAPKDIDKLKERLDEEAYKII